jgi:hypothetical protein
MSAAERKAAAVNAHDHKETGMSKRKVRTGRGAGRAAWRLTVLAAGLSSATAVWAQQGGASTQPLPGIKTPLLAPGPACSRGEAFVVTEASGADYTANRDVGRIQVEIDRNEVPADGQSAVKVTVSVFDRKGQPLCGTAMLTLEAPGSRLLLPGALTDEQGPGLRDADRVVPGSQLVVRGGVATFSMLAPGEPRDVRLRVSAGDQEAEGTVSFIPELREMLAAGLIEGVINFRGNSASFVNAPRNDDGFEREIRRWERDYHGGKSSVGARAAMFLKGTVRGDVLLTAAYDSDKETRARLLRDIKPDEFYPVYGDSSLKGFDARSAERLYVRVDQGKRYALYGDFQTGDGFSQVTGGGQVAPLRQRALGNYNRTATGARLHEERDGLVGNAWAFNDTLRQVVEEFPSQGSGPYGLRNAAVLENSEKVEVVVRDRNQVARILSVRALTPLVDYSFEPFSGRILLSTFLPAFDENLNPVSLRVSYEVDQGGDKFWVGGVDAQLAVNSALEVGGSYVKDDNPLAGYTLGSANVGLRLGPKTQLIAEVARSTSEVNTNPVNQATSPGLQGRVGDVSGQAWRAELAHEGERTEARVYAGRADPEFNNSAAPLAGGRAEYAARGAYKVTDATQVYVEGMRSEDNNTGGGERHGGQLGLKQQLSERLTLDVGVRAIRESAGTFSAYTTTPFSDRAGLSGSIATGSAGGALGYGQQPIDPASGLPLINNGSSLGNSDGSVTNATPLSTDTVRARLGYKATERITLAGEVEHDIHGEDKRRVALGADYLVAERTRLYGRYERDSGLSSLYGVTGADRSASAFAFGVSTQYLRDTEVFTEYRMRDAVSGRDLQQAAGVRNFWDVSPGVRLNTAVERTQVVSGSAPDTAAVALGLDYATSPLWKASTRVEWRRSGDVNTTAEDDRFDTGLWQLTLARKISRDWTAMFRNYLLATNYVARGDVLQNRLQLGAAYRDTDTNRVNAFTKYEYKVESDRSGIDATGQADAALVGSNLRSAAHIVSAHADYHPSRPWWLTGRVAGKWQADRFAYADAPEVRDRFRAQLVSGRVVYDVTENWDVGALLAVQLGQHRARQQAAGLEAGYLLAQNLWLSAGFNWAGFRGDTDLSGYEYTQRGAYIRLRFKFDENLFKRSDREVNRSLDR